MKKLDDWADWLAEGRLGPVDAAVVFAALYCAFQVVSLALLARFAPGVGIDDAEQLIYLPYLQAGYGGSQPPLYTWLNWLATHVTGVNVFTLKAVKYLLLFLALWAIHAAVRCSGLSRRTAATALFATLLLPQVGWEMQRALSHSVAAFTFAALTLLAFVHLQRRANATSYVLLGLAAAGAVLGKYNNLFFLAAFFAAAMTVRPFRATLLDRRITASIGAALLAMAPTLLWNIRNPDTLLARTGKFGMDQGGGPIVTALLGLQQTATAVAVFVVLPVATVAVAAWFAGGAWRERRPVPPPVERFLWRTVVIGVALITLLVLVSGATTVRARWLMPVLFLVPVAIAVSTERLGTKTRRTQSAVILCGAMLAMLAAPALWYTQLFGGSGLGRTIRLDYPALYRDLTAGGPLRTVVSDESWIGNLRFVDPQLTLLTEEVPGFATRLEGPTVLVWLDVPCPKNEVLQPLLQAGYTLGEQVELTISERFGDGRTIYAARLQQQRSQGTATACDQ